MSMDDFGFYLDVSRYQMHFDLSSSVILCVHCLAKVHMVESVLKSSNKNLISSHSNPFFIKLHTEI